jgi:hypothetical protein
MTSPTANTTALNRVICVFDRMLVPHRCHLSDSQRSQYQGRTCPYYAHCGSLLRTTAQSQ